MQRLHCHPKTSTKGSATITPAVGLTQSPLPGSNTPAFCWRTVSLFPMLSDPNGRYIQCRASNSIINSPLGLFPCLSPSQPNKPRSAPARTSAACRPLSIFHIDDVGLFRSRRSILWLRILSPARTEITPIAQMYGEILYNAYNPSPRRYQQMPLHFLLFG